MRSLLMLLLACLMLLAAVQGCAPTELETESGQELTRCPKCWRATVGPRCSRCQIYVSDYDQYLRGIFH